jgi:hypothetical protein
LGSGYDFAEFAERREKKIMATKNMLIGEAGKYRVAAELLLRGINVYFPSVDDGVDLFTDNGLGIQVKAANKNCTGNYYFSFKSWSRRKGVSNQLPRLHYSVTHVILWGITDDVFWIVPASIVRQGAEGMLTKAIAKQLDSSRAGRIERFKGAWESLQIPQIGGAN